MMLVGVCKDKSRPLTAIHESREEAHRPSFHTRCSSEELDMAMRFPVNFQAEEKGIKELNPENILNMVL